MPVSVPGASATLSGRGRDEDDRDPHRDSGPALARARSRASSTRSRIRCIVHLPVFAARAEGATITDVDGNRFIDFAGGVGVMNVGHAIRGSSRRSRSRRRASSTPISPSSRTRATSSSPSGSARSRRSPARTRAAFFNAGTEAVENAVKFARSHTGRPAVIAFEGAFHGRTLLSMTMTSKSHPYKTGMGPFAPEVYRAPYPERVPRADAAEALAAARAAVRDARRAGARGGDRRSSRSSARAGSSPRRAPYIEGLRAICDRHGIVLVADEVQTGFGRTGRMFAMEHFGVEPDLIVGRQVDRGGPAALRRDRPGRDHGRARTRGRSAAPTSATRSPWRPRSPCSTSSRRRTSSHGR